jgi:ADP-heptose:LPS heptosyltransferase
VRILLTRTDRIGDLILSTPAIASVRASFPDARITMVTSTYNRVVMERNDDVDEVLSIPPGASLVAFGRTLRGYDLAIALAPLWADVRLIAASRARLRVGSTYRRRWLVRLCAPFLVHRLMISEADPVLCERDPHLVVRHEVEQLLDLVALAGATARIPRLRLDLRDDDRAVAARLPERPIVFHLGARWLRDGSTPASTLALMRELRALEYPLVVTVAPECEEFGQAVAQAGVADVVLRGLPFHPWAAVFERAACVVTVDTGATHVASAVGRPVVVAFEHRYFRLSSQEWAPYRVPSVSLRKPAGDDEASLARFRREIVTAVASLSKGEIAAS